jgi:hypothetical protein
VYRERLREVLGEFQERCLLAELQFDLLQHIVEVCREKRIFG